MSPKDSVVIEVFGEGKTDAGDNLKPGPPTKGVVPILLHTLCGKPKQMVVKRKPASFLQEGKGLWQKVRFAKRQAMYNGSQGAVFVLDSEGRFDETDEALHRGRDHELQNFPAAIGVAHPCIEAWLLADGSAIRRALGHALAPPVPPEPESLPAPCQDRKNNPKTALGAASKKGGLSAEEKYRIAAEIKDMDLIRKQCPRGFAPFADEVDQRIRPLFA